jgi:CTP synthase
MDIDTDHTKFVFVVGGVMSGVGKGVATASLSTILESAGYAVNPIKADPYLNVDAGTMNPTEHGEVFVLDSGMECDQDMGNYERFLGRSLPEINYLTNGMVFKTVIEKERALEYDGKCVEPTYHISEEILRRITESSRQADADITIVEIGGTVGEYQNAIFIEAARVLRQENPDDVMFAMVSHLPTPPSIGEMKTKPTQNAVRELNRHGVVPDIIIGRAETPLDDKRKQKIANMCGVDYEDVISAPDVDNIYEIPLNFAEDNIGKRIIDRFSLESHQPELDGWQRFVDNQTEASDTVRIGIVGKYFATGDFQLSDAYISVIEALKISAAHEEVTPEIDWLDATDFVDDQADANLQQLSEYDGVIVPGGFGSTGIEGKINVIEFLRKENIPFFGLCYGMQLALVEFARNQVGLEDAHTTEIDENTPHPVVDLMPEQKEDMEENNYGGTMRLGSWPANLKEDTIVRAAYGRNKVSERHRHRYEVNNEYVDQLTDAGLVFSGQSPDDSLREIVELPESRHPFFVGTQFHPEFTARVLDPHPLFSAFVSTALDEGR